MVKKINKRAVLIKELLNLGYTSSQIAKKLKIRKQIVSYWKNTELKTIQYRRKKLDQEDIDKIIKLAENKTTSNMGSRKIASIMNKDFKKKGKSITISKNTVCRYLNKYLGKPRKIRKVFSLTNKKKKKDLNFVKKLRN